MRSKIVIILILSTILFYGISIFISGSIYPTDILHRMSSTSLRIDTATVTKSFRKYSLDDDILLSWPDSKDRLDLKWDSTWDYSVNLKGFNNISFPITIDSIKILDTKTNAVVFTIKRSGYSIESKKSFYIGMDIKKGFLYPEIVDIKHDRILDSLAEQRFHNKIIGIKIFSSFGVQFIIPEDYFTRESI